MVSARGVSTLIVCFLIASVAHAESGRSSVMEGGARFTALTERLVRMEFDPDGHFDGRPSLTFTQRQLPGVSFSVEEKDGWLELRTAALALRYKKNSGAFGPDNLQVRFRVGGESRLWHPGMDSSGNLLGTTRTVDGFEGERHAHEPDRKLQLENGLVSRAGWSLVDDSENRMFDEQGWVSHEPNRNQQDWYFFGHGHDYKRALSDFTRVAGKIPMPPRYALGYWWSRYWVYSDRELRNLVATIRDYDIPLDVLIVDMDWHKTYGLSANQPEPTPYDGMLGWTGYTWNRALFPEPERFLEWTEQRGLKVALNLHPADGVSPREKGYESMLADLDSPDTEDDWLTYSMADREWASAYFDRLLRPLEQQGVDFWWLDWQQWAESRKLPGLSNTFWLNHVFYRDMQRQYPDRRPLLFHRWGGLGNHRYQVGFSGDAVISWQSLAFQPYFTATASNVGYGYWSHDIGGHIVKDKSAAKDGELYLRWLQFGALSPILRTHSSKSDVAERRIWKYPDYFSSMREAIRLRYKLVPYLYNAAYQAYRSGVSMIRPMYYRWPEVEQAYAVPGQYMLGDDLLVAPVTEKSDPENGLASQTVWLPEGKWFDVSRGALLKGGQSLTGLYSKDEIPIFAKAGSIIPKYPVQENLKKVSEQLQLTIIPGGDGSLRLFEDDGDSLAYREGGGAFTSVESRVRENGLTVTIAPVQGQYAGMPTTRRYQLRLPRSLPVSGVSVNGRPFEGGQLSYDGYSLEQIVTLAPVSVEHELRVEISYPPDWQVAAGILNGKAGLFRRLETMAQHLKLLSARNDWGATIPPGILKLVETPTRLDYRPQDWQKVLSETSGQLDSLQSDIAAMPQISPGEADGLVQSLSLYQQ